MVKVGDKIRFVPSAFNGATAGFGIDLGKPIEGKIIFINKEHGWCRVEWEIPNNWGFNHECFDLEEVKKLVEG